MSSSNQIWNRFDDDGSGRIDKKELGRMYAEAGAHLTHEQLDRQWARFDADGDGSVTREEFLRHVHSTGDKIGYRYRDSHGHTEYLFKKFDRNRDGFLDREELREFYHAAGHNIDHRALDVQLKYLNANHRGVDLQNFRTIVTVNEHGKGHKTHHAAPSHHRY